MHKCEIDRRKRKATSSRHRDGLCSLRDIQLENFGVQITYLITAYHLPFT